jgi:alkanesulfonate monooxygenase SsuD/methylene tetrahydromethanopterin reductase-like flavin-dependent oxidoreductase (luciferase family)
LFSILALVFLHDRADDGSRSAYRRLILASPDGPPRSTAGAGLDRPSADGPTSTDGTGETATDAGGAREVLSAAVRDYALVGSPEAVREQVARLRTAGVDTVVGYPAAGLEQFVE